MTLVIQHSQEVSADHTTLIKKALEYKAASISPNTRRTYLSMWNSFTKWCEGRGLQAFPTNAETIALYLSDIGGIASFSRIDATIAAIEKAHKEGNAVVSGNPQLYRDIRKGIRKTHKERLKIKQAPALSVVDLKIALKGLGDNTQDIRDRALVTLGYWGAFRRSELASITYENLTFTENGVIVYLLGSKTSDTLEEIYVSKTQDPLVCPVRALVHWLNFAEIKKGPVFRSLVKGGSVSNKQLSGHSVSHIMKRLFGSDYSGHSLRRGVITETANKGVPVHEIQKFSRHRSADMVLRYAEQAKGFESTAAKALGV